MTRRSLLLCVASVCILALAITPAGTESAFAGASFAVDSTVDAVDAVPGDGACATLAGQCTLRAAVQQSNALPGNDTIIVPAGFYQLTIPQSAPDDATGDLDITDDVTITGAGAANTIVDAGDLDRVFQVGPTPAGVNADISGVTAQNGTAAGAGGITVQAGSALTLTDSVVSGNTGSAIAGGIGNLGTLVVRNSTVSGNSTGSEAGGLGGPGSNTVIDSVITGNTAGGMGGGIAVPPGGSLTVSASTISDNVAQLNGGGIAVGGTFSLADSTVTRNRSQANGGGIFSGPGGPLTNSTVSGNTAVGSGGGIFTPGTMSLSGMTVTGNSAGVDGGGIWSAGTMTISGSAVDGNSSGVNGGGIRNQEPAGTMTIENSSVSGNHSDRLSGGIANGGMLTVTGSEINDNSAGEIGGLTGGGIGSAGTVLLIESTVSGNAAAGTGGGIGSFGQVTLVDSTVSGNSTGANGGGIAIAAPLSVRNSTISGNSAATDGGGISLIGTPASSLNNVTITANSADSNGDGVGNGGGVNPAAGTLSLSNTIVAGNSDARNEQPDCSGVLTSQGYNLIQNTSGCVIVPGPGDITGQSAQLAPLADNGGLTRTHALLEGSPAIDAGNTVPEGFSSACEGTDQRGVVRPQDGDGDGDARCDIGAFEVQVDEGDIRELPVAFEVINSNTSGLACPSDGESYTVRGHINGPKRALFGAGSRVITLYLYGLETGEWNWRFTEVPGYNWPREMAKAGHISLTIDQLGYGASGHPHGALTCLGSLADISHQIVGQLRGGTYSVLDGSAPPTFQTVLLAGHDVGGPAAEVEAYSYKDVDGLIVMGWAEQGATPYILTLFARTAATECATGGQNPHDDGPGGGYFFMAFDSPEDRAPLFDDMDPRVQEAAIAMRHKNPCGYLLPGPAEAVVVDRARLREIAVPVLLLYSNSDPVFAKSGPTGGTDQQPDHFSGSEHVTLQYASTGHFPMLERGVDDYRGSVSHWLCAHGFISESTGLGGCRR